MFCDGFVIIPVFNVILLPFLFPFFIVKLCPHVLRLTFQFTVQSLCVSFPCSVFPFLPSPVLFLIPSLGCVCTKSLFSFMYFVSLFCLVLCYYPVFSHPCHHQCFCQCLWVFPPGMLMVFAPCFSLIRTLFCCTCLRFLLLTLSFILVTHFWLF